MERNYSIEKRHINDIKPGDTVLIGGELRTNPVTVAVFNGNTL